VPGRSTPRVLIADDDPSVRSTFRQALTRAGYDVVEAEDGKAALDRLAEVEPDLLLLDVQMPGMSGLEVIESVRSDPTTATVPIILVTGLDDADDRVRGLEAGATDYVTKPVYLAELVARVDAHLRTRWRVGDRIDASLTQRSTVLDVLARVPATMAVTHVADVVCHELRRVDGIAWTLLVELGDVPSVLGADNAGHLLPGDDIPADMAQLLIDRTGTGPWVEPGGLPGSTAPGGVVSAAPVLVGDKPWSVLLVGSGSSDALARSLHLSTVIDAAALTALVVAPRLHTATDAEQVRHELGTILRAAAFFPVFQPVVELTTRRVVGFEALTRFTDGERPDLRFAAAHRVGIGTRLEAATLRAILAQEPFLPDETWLSVNASPSLIVEGDTLSRLAAPIERPLVVEITEHDPVDDYGSIRASLGRLGPDVRLSVDDAGAGYASLRHVLALAPAFLKLDRSWVAGVDGDTNRRELLAGIALFAERTGCTLIAEGIERQEEVDVLEGLGVPLGQGYLLGRPEPLEVPSGATARRAGPTA
jgi:EAL domain-containing protein (putative c-di-GMP-specific phosphodiesterase class I)/CheY-like chemotaxis protein